MAAYEIRIRSMKPGEAGLEPDRRASMYAESLAQPASHRFLIAVTGSGEVVASAHAQLAPYVLDEVRDPGTSAGCPHDEGDE